MPVSYEQIISNSSEVTFTYQGDTVTVWYCPGKIDDKAYSKIMSFAQSGVQNTDETLSSVNDLLASLIDKWDVYEDAKQTKMFPLVPEKLALLPVSLKIKALVEVATNVRPED